MIDKMAEAIKEGNPSEALSVVCLHVDSSEAGIKEAAEALSLAHHRLGEASPAYRPEVMQKLAHMEVKVDNPISTAFGAFRHAQIKVAEIRVAQGLAKDQKKKINSFLQDHIR